MDELKEAAVHCGLSSEQTEFATGGFLSVLKKSAKLKKNKDNDNKDNNNDDVLDKAMNLIAGEEETAVAQALLKEYESTEFKDKLPKPSLTMLIPRPVFAPPGPPPPVIASIMGKAIRKMTRKDKDAGNTEDAIKLMIKKGLHMEEEGILKFMAVFIAFMEEKGDLEIVSEILVLPEEDTK
mmetsp:Transcript_7482/g.17968  ORF Transcript_7482/g.17968 Transcript_7482/m.17968 type:complete len:181 (-) Transcript_7482:143-685(-)